MVYLQNRSDLWQVGWGDRGCNFSGDVCCCQSGATTSRLPLVKCMEWCESVPAAESLAQLALTGSAEHVEQHSWEKWSFCHHTCQARAVAGWQSSSCYPPHYSCSRHQRKTQLHSPSVCCGTWVLKIKHIKIQKQKKTLHVCLGYIQEYQYFICLCLLSWEILASKARLNISPLQESSASWGSRK